ncbi:MAG: M23 family metallopeptidase [Clostridia bacterium]|nr:M23 family metallopeptidase [Clostridia bacterium]
MKRNKQTKQPSQKHRMGCLPIVILMLSLIVILASGQTTLRKNLDYFMRGEADIGQFLKDVTASYQKNLTYPEFIYPLNGTVTSPFGERLNPLTQIAEQHTGIDIDINAGTDVKAAADGIISKTGTDERFGNYILISHNDQFTTCYAHLEQFTKQEGETVKQGDSIGIAGSTGNTTGPHLHFEIRKGEKRMNPVLFLPKQ